MCEMPSVYHDSTPKARKAHRCCECHGTIQPGEKYHRHSGIWDGTPGEFKVCCDCEALREQMNKDVCDYEDQVPLECVAEHAFDNDNYEWMSAFIAIRRKRGVEIPPWMEARTEAAKHPTP